MDLGRIEILDASTVDELKSSDYLESMIPRLGFNNEIIHEQPKVVADNPGGLLIWQYPNQFSKYLVFLHNLGIRSYIEIGCRWGGTFVLTAEYLKRFGALTAAVAVDIIRSPVKEYCDRHACAKFMQVDSKSAEFAEFAATNFFDLVFIDGDHGYEGVKSDYQTMKDRGRIFVFHDITSAACPGVVQFWNELKNTENGRYTFVEFSEQYDDVFEKTHNSYLGIGVALPRGTS